MRPGRIATHPAAFILPLGAGQQLRALAQLRPPPALSDDYQGFIGSLADELVWIALMLGSDASDEALQRADQGLAESASEASDLVRESRLNGCLLAAEHGG